MISSFLKQTEGNVTIVVISGNNEELKSSLYSHYPLFPVVKQKTAAFLADMGCVSAEGILMHRQQPVYVY